MTSNTELVDKIFESGISFITGVPDSEFADLIRSLEAKELNERYVLATREDNAVGIAAGSYLAGKQPLVFMESSGFGNIVDALSSLLIIYGIPVVLYIAWAGYKGRDVPHHNAMGESIAKVLRDFGVPILEVDLDSSANNITNVMKKAMLIANEKRGPVAILGIPGGLK